MELDFVSKTKDVIIGAEKEMSFSIDADNPLIFEILRDKMYSNKIGSICREIASNSRDANREAGNGHLPITININYGSSVNGIGDDSHIAFRDRGIGISPSRMENIFIKYASSTKRDTNAQTGGFGLGAKTPFAYTDTFTVTTICQHDDKRIKYIYTALIDASRKGKMVLFDSMETTEDTGTEILIPINDRDVSEFHQEVLNVTTLWGNKVLFYQNSELIDTKLDILYEDENVIIYKSTPYSTQEVLSIDDIIYPLNKSQVSNSNNPSYDRHNIQIAYKFPTGELTISANREAVQYDAETIKKIQVKMDLVNITYLDILQQEVDKCQSISDVCMFVHKILKDDSIKSQYDRMIHELAKKVDINNLEWYDKKIYEEIYQKYYKLSQIKHHSIRHINDFKRQAPTNIRTIYQNKLIYVDKKFDYRKEETVKSSLEPRIIDGESIKPSIILITPHSGATEQQIADDMVHLILTLGYNVVLSSEIERSKSPSISTPSKYYKPKDIVTIKGTNYQFDKVNKIIINGSKSHSVGDVVCKVHSSVSQKDYISSENTVIESILGKKIITINDRAYDLYFKDYCPTLTNVMIDDALINHPLYTTAKNYYVISELLVNDYFASKVKLLEAIVDDSRFDIPSELRSFLLQSVTYDRNQFTAEETRLINFIGKRGGEESRSIIKDIKEKCIAVLDQIQDYHPIFGYLKIADFYNVIYEDKRNAILDILSKI